MRDEPIDTSYRLEALEFLLCYLLGEHLKANPELEAAQARFNTRPLPDPNTVMSLTQGILDQHRGLSPDEVAPEATEEMEQYHFAVSLLLERARTLAGID